MKLLHILSFLLIACVACTSACRGSPRNPSCFGERNIGLRCRGCRLSIMWWYNRRTNQCDRMPYLGMGGNNNRWCSREICQRRCRR